LVFPRRKIGNPRTMNLKRRIAVAAAGASLLAAVPATEAATTKYPSSVRNEFIKGCTQGGGSKKACKCTIGKIERHYTLKQFEAVLKKFNKNGKLPAKIKGYATSCGKKYPSSGQQQG
jgi:hypothetical protein